MTLSNTSAGQPGSATSTLVATRATPTLGWAIRRAILGLVIMTVAVAAGACLLYFTIDPEAEARAQSDALRKPVTTGSIPGY